MLKSRFENVSCADYAAAAVLLREVSEQLMARLELMTLQPRRIVEVGCGAGYCTQLLRKRYPEAELLATEESSAMLEYAKASNEIQAIWLCSPLDQLPLENHSVDLVVSNLSLAWGNDVTSCLREWRRVLRPDGLLLLSSYGLDTLYELQGQPIQVPHLLDMHNLGDALIQVGLSHPVLDVEHFALTYKEQYQLQQELQAMGLMSKDGIMKPLDKNAEGVISISYEIVYGHAWQPEVSKMGVMEEGVVKIPLDQLRRR